MTDPLIPPDVDLRGLDYMPLLGNHLFGSEFNAAASDSEWRAAVTLWWAAWNQVPAGSLPGDDVALCRLADLGRDVKTWRKLRERALHGFVLCSDGRLYHQFLCEQAAIAWDKRVKERERKAKWRAEQDAKKAGRDADVPVTKNGTETGQERGRDADVPADGNRRDVTGRDDKEKEQARATTPAVARSPDDPPEANGHQPTPAGAVCRAMRKAGMQAVNPGDPRLLKLIEQGATLEEFSGTAAEAVAKDKGFAWVLAVVQSRRAEAQTISLAPAAPLTTASNDAERTAAYLREQCKPFTAEEKAAADAARKRAMVALGRAT